MHFAEKRAGGERVTDSDTPRIETMPSIRSERKDPPIQCLCYGLPSAPQAFTSGLAIISTRAPLLPSIVLSGPGDCHQLEKSDRHARDASIPVSVKGPLVLSLKKNPASSSCLERLQGEH